MSSPRIYQEVNIISGQRITLSKDASHHIAAVLRMRPGENITLFNGDNREFCATIVSTHKNTVLVDITAVTLANRESPRDIHLAQGLSKGERFEWVVQKAVELGAASITPIITNRCVVRLKEDRLEKKLEQWKAIAIAACEQSGRNYMPIIYPAIPLSSYLQGCAHDNRIILHPQAGQLSCDLKFIDGSISLLIGPEGGFCDEEVKLAEGFKFQSVAFGPRVLRTETAAVAALSVLQALVGDL